MDIGGVSGVGKAVSQLCANICHAIIIGVFKAPKTGRRRYVKGALVPQSALGKGHFVGEADGLVEETIAVGIFKQGHMVGELFIEFLVPEVQSGRLGNEQSSPIIKPRHDGVVYQGWPGDEFHDVAVRNIESRIPEVR